MKKKIFRIVAIALTILSGLSLFSGCANNDTNVKKTHQKISSKYVVDKESEIENDLKLFGMNTSDVVSDLALADIKAVFPGDVDTFFYFTMPNDTGKNKYRVKEITINDKEYKTSLIAIDGSYQKYRLKDFEKAENGEYRISKMIFIDEKSKETSTYNLSQEISAKIEEDKYMFEQEYHYDVVLSGQNFESVYQFNKETNIFIDLWAKVIPCVEKLDEDKRSFYYFAFNCYDPERNIYFIPEDILQLDVNFTLETYQYKGKKKEDAENIKPSIKKEMQSITADSVSVLAIDSKRSNKKLYKYETINKLSDADLTKNIESSNAGILAQAARQYDWAVTFGSREGYSYKNNKSGWPITEYDIDYSKIKDFKTINIKYRVDGKTFETKTSSLVKDKMTVVVEPPKKPSKDDKKEYNRQEILNNPNHNFLWKIKEIIKNEIKQFIPEIIIGLLVVLIVLILYRKGRKTIKKYIKLIKDKIGFNNQEEE